jgi:hypothetical protein
MKSPGFATTVLSVMAVPSQQTNRLAVIGRLDAGWLPPRGSLVFVEVEGRPRLPARIGGGPESELRPPKIGFIVEGLGAADVPVGARITTVTEPSAWKGGP